MFATSTLPSSSAFSVAGPPLSLIAVNLTSVMPYTFSMPGTPYGRSLNSGLAPSLSPSTFLRSAMDVTPSFSENSGVTLSESLSSASDASRISRPSGRASPSADDDVLGRGGGGVLVHVQQQVAGVLGEQVDLAVLEGRDVGLASADVELLLDLDVLGLEGLGVDLGDDLVLGERGRADGDRVGRGLLALGGISAAGGERQAESANGECRGESGLHVFSLVGVGWFRWCSMLSSGARPPTAIFWRPTKTASRARASTITRIEPETMRG